MNVIVTYQETEQNEENQPMMVTRRKEIETDEFDFIEATDILTGNKRDEHGNKIQGIRIGDKNYFRAIDIINISVE